jgi:CheY-like chemotaxis protein
MVIAAGAVSAGLALTSTSNWTTVRRMNDILEGVEQGRKLEVGSKAGDLAGRRVLVIEDESMVMMLLQDMLGDMGCDVIGCASRFTDAIEKARSLTFDVAILDVNLNGERTFPIADVLVARGICFVFATGYAAASLPATFNKIPILQKPFHQQELEHAMRAALT